MDHFKRNLPRHCVETLTDNDTVLNKELMEIRANMTKDPSWALRRITELVNLKGTTPPWTDADLKNFTFPDMGINDYDVSKSKGVDLNFSVETDYDKLKAKYDPYDLVNNKSINWDEPTFDDQMFEEFLKRRLAEDERENYIRKHNVHVTKHVGVNDRLFASKWKIPLDERQRNMSLYNTWIYRDNITIIPNRKWIPVEELNKTLFDRYATLDLDQPFNFTPIEMW